MREHRKVRLGISAKLICALVFGSIGMVYLPIGLGLGFSLIPEAQIFLWIFGGIGTVFLLTAALLLWSWARKRAAIQQAYDSGEKLSCIITDVRYDTHVRVNHRGLMQAVCEWHAPYDGSIHVFHSRSLRYCPESLIGKNVSVYIDNYNDKIYYMDIDEVLPDIVYH